MKTNASLLTFAATGVATCSLLAQPVTLQQPTATYSQPNYIIPSAIDANPASGWGVARVEGFTAAATAVFEANQDVQPAPGVLLTFYLRSGGFGGANLGRFRLSVTADDRSQFADGLINGGDVTANWEVLNPTNFWSVGGATLTMLPDNSILASGANPEFDTNIVVVGSSLSRITGFKIEVMDDPSLPTSGPGRAPNGNLVLWDFAVTAKPNAPDLFPSITVSSVDIRWQGVSNRMYQVQYSSELTTNLWVNLGTPVQGNGSNYVTDVTRQTEKRFYRIHYSE